MVNAPGQRYHPAIIAQAIGTLGAMYPGRFWAALGTGEASNEHITGDGWPRKDVRTARLRECVDVIRALLAGEEVSHDGLVRVDRARLWTRPEQPPALVGAAVSVATARWCAEWADGLITVNAPVKHLREMIDAYRDAGGRGPLHLQVHVCWAPEQEQAEAIAYDQWRSNVFAPPVCWDLETAEHFDVVSADVPLERVAEVVNVSADLGRHVGWLEEYLELGFDQIALHHVGQEQRGVHRHVRRGGAAEVAHQRLIGLDPVARTLWEACRRSRLGAGNPLQARRGDLGGAQASRRTRTCPGHGSSPGRVTVNESVAVKPQPS